MSRRTYKIAPITVNEEVYTEVVIDSHYELKHLDHINDELILSLVILLDGAEQLPEDTKGPFKYYATIIELENKAYRLVWLLEDGKLYIGVINSFRDSKGELQ
jgi:hypothetical protein